MEFPSPLTYDGLVDTGVFKTNHIDDNASFDGLMFETYGDELDYVFEVSQKHPNRVATILDCDGGTYLAHGFHLVNRLGYLVATEDLPEFVELVIEPAEVDGDTQDDVEFLTGVAAQHGQDSEPDHEAGDLQAFLRGAFNLLSLERRKELFHKPGMIDAIAGCVGKESAEVEDDLKDHQDFSAEGLIAAAKTHGEEEDPGHEIGDLHAFLAQAFAMLAEDERGKFYRNAEVRSTLAAAVGVDLDELNDSLPENRR